MNFKIPFNKPTATGSEAAYMADAMARGHISGNGYYTHACQSLLEQSLAVPKAILTTSCTDALEIAALLLRLGPDDEFIVPSFAFVTTANAFVLRGARPVFADIRPDTLNIDERKLEKLITKRTKAIIVLHYAGIGCEMDAICRIAKEHGIAVVEDNAHGLFGKYRDQYLGTFGTLAAQSFHETKNFTCGEGGAILINDPTLIPRAEIISEKGTDRSKFFRGEVHKYGWMDVGSSYLPSDLLAAFLLAQLEQRDTIQRRRKEIWCQYRDELLDWATRHGVRLPFIPSDCEQPYHMFYILMPSLATRSNLINHLQQRGIHAVHHYLPLHTSKVGRELDGNRADCPVTEIVSDTLLRLPFFNSITQDQQALVIDAIRDFNDFGASSEAAAPAENDMQISCR